MMKIIAAAAVAGCRFIVTRPKLHLVPPATKNGTVAKAQPPTRPKNEDLREREHLRPEEIERLIEAARGNRYGGRDALMILMPTAMACAPPR